MTQHFFQLLLKAYDLFTLDELKKEKKSLKKILSSKKYADEKPYKRRLQAVDYLLKQVA